ncbi:MAG: TRASH domain-containing protein [candidate division Zixibacteria bacterium]|nr:TRASH domain-containing protein [candidate division Zixibacteria bacterium]
MQVCDYCGIEIEGAPVRRKKHVYCSRTCAEEHEFELVDADEEGEYEMEEEEDEEAIE